MEKIVSRNEMENLSAYLYDHQNFKFGAIKNNNSWGLSETTFKNYLYAVSYYCRTGKRKKALPNYVFEYIDKFKSQNRTILEPNGKQKVRTYNRRQEALTLKTTKISDSLRNSATHINISQETMQKIKQNTQHVIRTTGVKFGNNIKLFEDPKIAQGFIMGIKEITSRYNDPELKDLNMEVININYTVQN